MTTEAEIIPEPISLVKTEEESKHLNLEPCEKDVESLPGELRKLQGEVIHPAEVDESSAKVHDMEVDGNGRNGTVNSVSEGNHEITKSENVLVSPEIAKVASKETCKTVEHNEVDDTSYKVEKVPEDEEKVVTEEKEVKKETEDKVEKCEAGHGYEELNSDNGEEKRAEGIEATADQEASLEEKHKSIEGESNGTKTDEIADIESNKQETSVELEKQASIDVPGPTVDTMKEANETVTEASNSNLVQEVLQEKSLKEVEETEQEKLHALEVKEEGTEAIGVIETSESKKDQIISDCSGDTSPSTVADCSEIKDHETSSKINEDVNTELHSTYEVASVREPEQEVGEKCEEVSDITNRDKSQDTIESSEEIKHITEEKDGIEDKNVLDTSSVMETVNTVEENPKEESGQSDIHEKTNKDPSTSSELCKGDANSESEVVMETVHATEKEPAVTEESYVYTEQEAGKSKSVSEAIEVSNREEPKQKEDQSDACEAKALQDEQPSDLGSEREKNEEVKPKSMDSGETSDTCKDGEKTISEEVAENLEKPESLKEDTEVEKGETELPREVHDQIPEVVNLNDNAENVNLAVACLEENPKVDSEALALDLSKETFPEDSKKQVDGAALVVQSQESEKDRREEPEDKLKDEEVTKDVILSEEVSKEAEKADVSEDIKEHVMEEESSKNEHHPESKIDETTNEAEDNTSASTVCLQAAESNEQIETNKSAITSGKISTETTEIDANQESKDVENVQLEEVSSEAIKDEAKVEEHGTNVEIIDKEKTDAIKTDTDAVNTSKDDEGGTSLTAEKAEQLPSNAHEVVETKSEASKTSNADDVTKIEVALDVDNISEDKSTDQDAETKKSLTMEDLEVNKVEETKGISETSSDCLPQRVESAAEDDISSNNTIPEEKPKDQIQPSVSALPCEDEEIKTAGPIEKTKEEIQKDAEIVKHEDVEDSSDSKVTEEVCLQKEEEREPKAVVERKTIVDQDLQKEEPEEQVQTTSSTLASEEGEHGTDSTSEEIKYEKSNQEEVKKQDVRGDEITGEPTLSANQPEEGTASSTLLSKEQDKKSASKVEIMEEEKVKDSEFPENRTAGDSSDAKETAEICLKKEEVQELEGDKKDETDAAAAQTIPVEEPNEQSFTSSSVPSENLEHGTTANVEGVEEEKVKEVERLEKEICLKEQGDDEPEPEALVGREITVPQASRMEEPVEIKTIGVGENEGERKETEKLEDPAARETEEIGLQKDENASSQTLPLEKPEEQNSNSVVLLPSYEHKNETLDEVDKIQEENVEEKVQNEDSDGGKMAQEISSKKDELKEPPAALESETIASQVLVEESQEHEILTEEKKIGEEERLEDNKSPQPECVKELQSTSEDGANAAQIFSEEKQADQLHSTTPIMSSAVQEDEKKKTELQKDEGPDKIPEQTREIEEASNAKTETQEKAFDNKLPRESEDAADKEKLVEAIETGGADDKFEETNKGNVIIPNEVENEEVMKDKEITETSHSISHSEKQTNHGSGEDELKDKQIDDKTNEALETTCQTEEPTGDAQKTREDMIIEKQIDSEDKTVEVPGQVAVAKIETAAVTEKESSTELSQVEGTRNLAEVYQIIEDIESISSIGKESVPVDSQDKVAESSENVEVEDVKEIYPKVVEHCREKPTDNSGEELTKESTSVEDLTKVSSSQTLKLTPDITEERDAKDETCPAIIPVEKPEEQLPAPSSELPSKEGEHVVSTKADMTKEKEVKVVETQENDSSSDAKIGEDICLEKGENKELKAVVEPETVAVPATTTKTGKDPVSHIEDVSKEDELKDENAGDQTSDTVKIPTNDVQDKLSLETLKDGANNNIEKENIAADETVKDLEQVPVDIKDATIVREEIPEEVDATESSKTQSLISEKHFPTEQHDRALEIPEKPRVGDLVPGKVPEICSEVGVDNGEEKKGTDSSGVEINQEPASPGKLSLHDLLQRSTREQMEVAERVIEEKELTEKKEEPPVEEAETIQAKETKPDEVKDEGEAGDEQNSGSDAPVMIEAPREIDTKPHKKSHNILSGVGSKVKHSISKVKKAITGKSSHSKEPKPISPKEAKPISPKESEKS